MSCYSRWWPIAVAGNWLSWDGVFLAVAVSLLISLAWPSDVLAEPGTSPPEMLADAALFDIQFADADRGWAVGERGVIWLTDDGGRHWRLADSPVNCRLDAVHFVDDQHGWAVGGWVHAYTHRSSAVVLQTDNGGQRWRRIATPTLPALCDVQMLDKHRGWAIGDGSAMYPAGVFRTDDGGRSWHARPGVVGRDWLAASFHDRARGVCVGRDGALFHITSDRIQTAAAPPPDWRHLRDVQLDGNLGWIVGDGGRVLQTRDGGGSWQPVALPSGAGSLHDFQAVAMAGEHCWIAGSPGGFIWHSADGGATWQKQATGISTPLAAITFLDEQRGWAAGALGTILATRDGGRTWRVQRSGGKRAAWLCLLSEPNRTPYELVARLSGDEGFLGVAEYLARRDIEQPRDVDAPDERRAWASVALAGGSYADTAWAFPLRQPGLDLPSPAIIAGWNVLHEGAALERLEERVVRKIRQWRPDVVVTEHLSNRDADSLAHLVNQVVVAAVQRAGDAGSYPQHVELAGLEPWNVTKVFAVLPDDEVGTLTLESARLATRLGCSLGDRAQQARGLWHPTWQRGPQKSGFQMLINRLPQAIGERDFLSGVALERPSEARRAAGGLATTDLDSLTRLARKKNLVQRLLERAASDPAAAMSWLAQVDDLTAGLDSPAAGDILGELGQNFSAAGRLDLAADVLGTLVQRYPEHTLAEASALWLVRYYTSVELACWADRSQHAGTTKFAVQHAVADEVAHEQPRVVRLGTGEPLLAVAGPSPQALHSASHTATPLIDRQQRAARLLAWMQQTRPALFAEPPVQFLAAANATSTGRPRDARQLHSALALAGQSAWVQAARGELWFGAEQGPAPKPLLQCVSVSRPPRLDGQLDEAAWESVEPALLTSPLKDDDAWPAEVLLAHDDRFLYLAARCRKVPGLEYPASDAPRPRDPDVTAQDRVDLLLDIDRDYNTWFRLKVDHRGWNGEACCGNASWNPTWYVASAASDEEWRIEAAISLDELTPAGIRPREAWAIGIQRTVPGIGFQSWHHPAAAATPRPEGFGYLQFR